MGYASPARGGYALDLHAAHTADMPVTGVVERYPAAHRVPRHSHPRGHLIYASSGVLLVQADSGQWLVPPTTAVWLRPGVVHGLTAVTAVVAHGLFVAEPHAQQLARSDGVVQVSPLLRALVTALVAVPHQPPFARRDQLMGQLLVEELCHVDSLPLHLPWPQDAALRAVCEQLVQSPAQSLTAEAVAARHAMTAKTLHRRFVQGTGMTFGKWRQTMRLMHSIEALLQGQSITQVALDSGYESHSAYTAAFKKVLGCPPSALVSAAAGAG